MFSLYIHTPTRTHTHSRYVIYNQKIHSKNIFKVQICVGGGVLPFDEVCHALSMPN